MGLVRVAVVMMVEEGMEADMPGMMLRCWPHILGGGWGWPDGDRWIILWGGWT